MKKTYCIICLLVIGFMPLTYGQISYPGRPEALAYPLWDIAEEGLITASGMDDPMRVFVITQEDDSLLLRKASHPVNPDPNDPVLKALIDRMFSTVTDSASLGLGIAAPQVGVLRQVIWVQRLDKEGLPFEAYLNPKIVQYSKAEQCQREGCLSIPNKSDSVFRAQSIMISYDTPQGAHIIEMVEGFTAVIFQHEIDHLNGILYVDHVAEDRKRANKATRE